MQGPPGFQYSMLEGEPALAFRQDGAGIGKPGMLFLPGFFSNMTGTKAGFLAERCQAAGRVLTRFDYRGHGFSGGRFEDGTIGGWLDDALRVFDAVTKGPQVLVGSSMGGWIMLLLALKRPDRVAGLVGLAPAPDFTEDLLWKKLSAGQREEMQKHGVIHEKSEYEDAVIPLTLRLVEEGRRHCLLDGPMAITCPVRILQGMRDQDVPWGWALRCAESIKGGDVRVTLIKDGDHRLSRPEDLDLLWREIENVAS